MSKRQRHSHRTLWLAVVAQALEDRNEPPQIWVKGKLVYNQKHCPLSYFYSEDFNEVCGLAELIPEYVRSRNGIPAAA